VTAVSLSFPRRGSGTVARHASGGMGPPHRNRSPVGTTELSMRRHQESSAGSHSTNGVIGTGSWSSAGPTGLVLFLASFPTTRVAGYSSADPSGRKLPGLYSSSLPGDVQRCRNISSVPGHRLSVDDMPSFLDLKLGVDDPVVSQSGLWCLLTDGPESFQNRKGEWITRVDGLVDAFFLCQWVRSILSGFDGEAWSGRSPFGF
jgi:hypothetical protein